jgi:hypothetical protein
MTRIVIEAEIPTDAEEGFKQGKRAFVVPLSETETMRLGTDVIVVHEGLAAMADSLVAFVEGRELYGKPDPELKAALEDIASHLREMGERQGRTREVFGRAVFVNVHPARKRNAAATSAAEESRRKATEASNAGLLKLFGMDQKKGPVQ